MSRAPPHSLLFFLSPYVRYVDEWCSFALGLLACVHRPHSTAAQPSRTDHNLQHAAHSIADASTSSGRVDGRSARTHSTQLPVRGLHRAPLSLHYRLALQARVLLLLLLLLARGANRHPASRGLFLFCSLPELMFAQRALLPLHTPAHIARFHFSAARRNRVSKPGWRVQKVSPACSTAPGRPCEPSASCCRRRRPRNPNSCHCRDRLE